MSEEKFKGSDGVDRTLIEWYDFISERSVLSDGVEPMEVAMNSLRATISSASFAHFLEKPDELNEGMDSYEDALKGMAESAGRYFTLALDDAIKSQTTLDRTLEKMKSHLDKMARYVTKFGISNKPKCFDIGMCVLAYIYDRESIPNSPQELERFIGERCIQPDFPVNEPMSRRTIAEYLPWFKLEDICRGNGKG